MKYKRLPLVFLFLVSLILPLVSADCNGNSTTCNSKNDTLTCAAQSGCFWTATNNSDNGFNHLSIVLTLIAFAALFVFVGSTIEQNKWLIKSAMYFTSLLLMIICISVGLQIADTKNLSTLMNSALIIGVVSFSLFIVFIFVNYLRQIAKAIKDSRKEKETELD